MKHKKIAVAGFAASMLLGAGTGLVLNIPGGTSASGSVVTATPTDTADSTDTTDSTVAGTTDDTANDVRPEKGMGLTTALADLVTAGTITQDQSDAVTAAIAANHGGPGGGQGRGRGGEGGPGGGHEGHEGRGGPGRMGGDKIAEAAATALGVTTDELKTELDAGKTIAEVAAGKGVDVQTVIDAIVADQTADITERVTGFVNGVKPTAPVAPADDATATTTD